MWGALWRGLCARARAVAPPKIQNKHQNVLSSYEQQHFHIRSLLNNIDCALIVRRIFPPIQALLTFEHRTTEVMSARFIVARDGAVYDLHHPDT